MGVLRNALTASGFWDRFNTDWVCLDGELMPWSAKAKDLLIKQYAPVGNAAKSGMTAAVDALKKTAERGIDTLELTERFQNRATKIDKYVSAYRQYSKDTNGIDGLVFAPFHLLASEKRRYFDKSHVWHLEELSKICAQSTKHLLATKSLVVDLSLDESREGAINWWLSLTKAGGEGMVVKPIDFIGKFKGRMIQPAIKCRGSEYLRIIYGPEYDDPANLERLKLRNVKNKRIWL